MATGIEKDIDKSAGAEDQSPALAEQGTLRTVWAFLSGPYPTLVSRLALSLIFLLSGLTKLGVPATFADNINSYEMPLPDALVQAMAYGLPVLELGLGAWLILGLFTRFSGLLSAVLMVIFLIAMTQAAFRGLDPNCGCVLGAEGNKLGEAAVRALGPIGNWLTNERVGLESIARDAVFLLMSLHLMFVPTTFSLDNLRGRGSGVGAQEDDLDSDETP